MNLAWPIYRVQLSGENWTQLKEGMATDTVFCIKCSCAISQPMISENILIRQLVTSTQELWSNINIIVFAKVNIIQTPLFHTARPRTE